MTAEAKLNRLTTLLGETGSDEDKLLEEYLAIAKDDGVIVQDILEL